ncbi:MAG: PEP-CTERM sorting domain-containing protein [Thermoguttaceae bacterium]|jgi:flagellin
MFRLASYAGIVLACCILATPSFAELVANGGFESGNFTGWTTLPASSGSDFYVGSNYPHSDLHEVNFGAGLQYDDSIMQTLPTVEGQSYKIDFWLAHPNYDTYANFTASWDGNTILSLVNSDIFYYTKYSFTLPATTTSTTLQFSGRESVSFVFLDDVSVQPVPEPSALVLLSAGVFGFLAYVFRKQK